MENASNLNLGRGTLLVIYLHHVGQGALIDLEVKLFFGLVREVFLKGP